MPFEEYLPRSVPGWLRGPWGTKYFTAVGRRMDQVVQVLRDAATIKYPALAPVDALPYIATERGLPRGPSETEGAHRARLDDAWNLWAGDPIEGGGGGSPLGMLRELKVAGIPVGPTGATIVQQNGRWWRLDASDDLEFGDLMNCIHRTDLTGTVVSRPGWTFDGRDNFWSAFGIIFPSLATPIEGATLNDIVEKWRPGNMLYIGAWVLDTGSDQTLGWPATGRTLGTEPNLGGNIVIFIPGAGGDHARIGYYP